MSNSLLLGAACHEAGHAVATIVLSGKLISVAVYPGAARGELKGKVDTEGWPQRFWRRHILTTLCGPAAQHHRYPNTLEEHDAAPDRLAAEKALEAALTKAADVRENQFDDDNQSDDQFDRSYRLWDHQAQRLVRTHRFERATLALVDALRATDWTLSGEAATAIIRSSSQRLGEM